MPYQVVNLDIGFMEIFEAMKDSIKLNDKQMDLEHIQSQISSIWQIEPKRDLIMPSFCVRASLDLYFQSRNFPAGSEVIMTAINLPDMVRIVTEHNLVPVPLDIDPKTMAPFGLQEFKDLITPKTKVFLAAFIYGVKFDTLEYANVCEEHQIDLLEDGAQAFSGTETWIGCPKATMSMFSFGLIKTQTCLNGAIGVIRDKGLHDDMVRIQ